MIRRLGTLTTIGLIALTAAALAQDAEARRDHETSLDYAQVNEVTVTVRDTGQVYGTRELLHPHDQEQPFTRSLRDVAVPEGVTQVAVRAKCNVHGFGGKEVVVDLTEPEGASYELREE